jgi:Ger(x)C family germination protein
MKKFLTKIKKNKFFYIFTLLIVLMFPFALYDQSDKDNTLVVTSVGIDKVEDNYNLTLLSVIPKGSNDISANLEIFKCSGKTISEALDNATSNTGRKVGLAHCDSLIISLDATEENIAKMLDYFIRTSNLSTNASVIISDGKAEDLINATKSSNNFLDLSLKNVILFQEKSSMISNSTIEQFYRTYLSKSGTILLPILSTEKPIQKDTAEGGGSGSEGNTSGGGSSTSGGEDNSGNQSKIKNDNRVLVLKQGVKDRELTEDEIFTYNLLSNKSDFLKITLENINDQYVTESTEVYQQIEKIVLPTYKFKNEKPVITYHIWLSLMIDEIESNSNYSYASLDGLQSYLSNTTKDKILTQLENKLNNSLNIMKENNDDILDIYDKFYAFKTSNWKEYIASLENPEEYLKDLQIELDVNLNYVV